MILYALINKSQIKMKCKMDDLPDYSGGLSTKLLKMATETECQAKADTELDKTPKRLESFSNYNRLCQTKFINMFVFTILIMELIFFITKTYKQVFYLRISMIISLLLYLLININNV
jgi:hypothetical protein